MKYSSVKNAERIGKYYVTRHPKGGFTFRCRGSRDRGGYVPPDAFLREKVLREKEELGKLTGNTAQQLVKRGILEVGRPDANAARKALGLPVLLNVPWRERRQQILQAIATFWPKEDVKRVLSGEDIRLGTITEFKKRFPTEAKEAYRYYSAHGWNEGLRKMIEQVHPNFYRAVHYSHHEKAIDKRALGDFVFDRWAHNLPNSRDEVIRSGTDADRALVGQITFLAKKAGVSYLSMAARLTKRLRYSDVAMSGSGKRQRDKLAEDFTYFVFSWGNFVKIDGLVEDPYVVRDQEAVEFKYDGKTGRADLRVNNSTQNQAIEVKTRTVALSNPAVTDMIKKYGSGNSWTSGENMDCPLVVLHMDPSFENGARERLGKLGVSVIGSGEFTNYLNAVTTYVSGNHADAISVIRPRIYDLEMLARTYHSLIYEPQVISHYGNLELQKQVSETLIALGNLGRKLRNGN